MTAANAGDASIAEALLTDVLEADAKKAGAQEAGDAASNTDALTTDAQPTGEATTTAAEATTAASKEPNAQVYGDASYGTADLVARLEGANIEANVKVQSPSARKGMFSQDAFDIDTAAGTACCPNGVRVRLRVLPDRSAMADFAPHCDACPLRAQCTTSKTGRAIHLHPKHDTLACSRKRQRDPAWIQRYRATRPKVERKIAHLMRRRHGGRRARLRGRERIGHDFAMLAAAANLSRLAVLKAARTA